MLPHYRINIQPRALNEINSICSYIERSSPQNAMVVARRIRDAIDSLDIFPHRYKVYRSHRDANARIRAMSVWPFIIYYRVSDSSALVEIIAVIHGARVQPKTFS
jgi:plasmid stabilization system protein ParE